MRSSGLESEKVKGEKVESGFFVLSIVIMVAAVFIYLKREDTDFAKLLRKISDTDGKLASIQSDLEEFQRTQRNVCAHLSTEVGELQGRAGILEERPRTMELQITKSVPFSVVVKKPAVKKIAASPKEIGNGAGALIPNSPMLNRAGIRSQKKSELNQ